MGPFKEVSRALFVRETWSLNELNSHDQLDPCLMVRKRTDNGKEGRKGSRMPLDKRESPLKALVPA